MDWDAAPNEPSEINECVSRTMVQLHVESLYEESESHIHDQILAERGIDPLSPEAEVVASEVDAMLDPLKEHDYTTWGAGTLHRRSGGHRAERTSRPHSEGSSRPAGTLRPTTRGPRTGDQLTGLARMLWAAAVELTPLPGTEDFFPNLYLFRPGQSLAMAGLWPHLRVPELAHYGPPGDQVR